MFGDKAKLDLISHLLGAAFGWGGNAEAAAVYDNTVPTKSDGKIAHALTVKDELVDGFGSITICNKVGFIQNEGPERLFP